MNLKSFVMPLSLALAVNAAACAGSSSDESNVAEGTAYLMAEEDGDTLPDDGAAAMSAAGLDEQASEVADDEADSTEPADVQVCNFRSWKQRVVAAYDADGNGTLDEAERAALAQDIEGNRDVELPRLRKLIKKARHYAFMRIKTVFDEDGNGTLDEAERAALADAMEARCERRKARVLAKYDTDGDGALSEAEIVAARADRRAAHQEHRRMIMATYDVNHDGILDRTERAALKEAVKDRIQAKIRHLVERYDANGDGKLDAAEVEALKADVRTRIATDAA